MLKVLLREVRVGALLGLLDLVLLGHVYGWDIGGVIGPTLLSICTLAATVGGGMPLIAKKLLGLQAARSQCPVSAPCKHKPGTFPRCPLPYEPALVLTSYEVFVASKKLTS